MFIVRFTSGLGNQMYQYAFYRYLLENRPGDEVLCDVSWFEWNRAHQGFELEKLFKRPDNPYFVFRRASEGQIWRLGGMLPQKGRLSTLANRVRRLVDGGRIEKRRISESGREGQDTVKERIDGLKPGEDAYFTGYFDRQVFFGNNLRSLKKAFSFPTGDLGEENKRLLREISSPSSVSIHVRRGDYLNKGYTEAFIKLSMDYYREAVETALKVVRNPRFYLFSDDKDYIKEAFSWLKYDWTAVDINSADMSWADMFLMSRCRVNITANSTFSAWAGLLNPSPEAVVIYPARYMKEKDSEIITLPGWVRI